MKTWKIWIGISLPLSILWLIPLLVTKTVSLVEYFIMITTLFIGFFAICFIPQFVEIYYKRKQEASE